MQAREGDLIRTEDNVIFDVKGLIHPQNKVIAFPRYIPNPSGSRKSRGEMYSKVYNLAERFMFLEKNKPELIVDDPVFGEKLCEVPINTIRKRYDPIRKMKALRENKNLEPLEKKAVMLAKELHDASGVRWSKIGISGSVMAGLFTKQSDIDPIVYGSKNCNKAYAALENLLITKSSRFKPYSKQELTALFDFRSKDTQMSYKDFERVETRKAFQGKYDGTDYFIRFIKDYNETKEKYGEICYKKAGYAKITATIADNSEALYTPCVYTIDNVKIQYGPQVSPITEITSFRGRFCKQAKINENVTVQGKIEQVINKRKKSRHYRVIIGNQPTDYMTLL